MSKLAQVEPYEGQKVWNGEWYAAPLYRGPRCLVRLRSQEMPCVMDAALEAWPTSGVLGSTLWHYSYRKTVPTIMLDGVLGRSMKDGMHFDRLKRGEHLPPDVVFFVDDLLSYKVFQCGSGSLPFSERREKVRAFVEMMRKVSVRPDGHPPAPCLSVRRYKRIESRKQFEALKDAEGERGFGLLLRCDTPYESGRSGHLLRVDLED